MKDIIQAMFDLYAKGIRVTVDAEVNDHSGLQYAVTGTAPDGRRFSRTITINREHIFQPEWPHSWMDITLHWLRRLPHYVDNVDGGTNAQA